MPKGAGSPERLWFTNIDTSGKEPPGLGSPNASAASSTRSAPQNTLPEAPYGRDRAERALDQVSETLDSGPRPACHIIVLLRQVTYISKPLFLQQNGMTILHVVVGRTTQIRYVGGPGMGPGNSRYSVTVRRTGYLDKQDKHVT